MRRIHWLALATLVMVSPTCFAASFDCAKASTPTEKTICADSVLSSLDTRLQQAYKDAMAAVTSTRGCDSTIENATMVDARAASIEFLSFLADVYTAGTGEVQMDRLAAWPLGWG